MVRVSGQLGSEPDGADGRRILILGAMGDKGFVGNVQPVFALVARFAHIECVLAHQRLGLESDVPHNCVVAHLAPGMGTGEACAGNTFLIRLVRGRFGGTPSAGSTTIRLVTNCLMPWTSKSTVVRLGSDWVMTPHPYRKCLMYWPAERVCTKVSCSE